MLHLICNNITRQKAALTGRNAREFLFRRYSFVASQRILKVTKKF